MLSFEVANMEDYFNLAFQRMDLHFDNKIAKLDLKTNKITMLRQAFFDINACKMYYNVYVIIKQN